MYLQAIPYIVHDFARDPFRISKFQKIIVFQQIPSTQFVLSFDITYYLSVVDLSDNKRYTLVATLYNFLLIKHLHFLCLSYQSIQLI